LISIWNLEKENNSKSFNIKDTGWLELKVKEASDWEGKSPAPIDLWIEGNDECDSWINISIPKEEAKFIAKSILNIIEK
jgi:hypothetical protein